MIEPKKPLNEASRLQDLYHYEVLDTQVEEEFDMLVELASRICETPISLLTLVDEDRQWFKAKLGIEEAQTERRVSFCAHAILQNDLLVIPDATKDERFFDNPYVTGDPSVRFYAGAQIRSAGGHKLGTLCVIDNKPRELSWHQASSLKILSTQASRLLELRYLKTHLQSASPEKETLRKQHAVSEWTAQQAVFFAETEEALLEPLKTGRFTKKELTNIYQQSKDLLRANKRFNQLLSLYNGAAEESAAPFIVSDLLHRIYEGLQQSVERKLPQLGLPTTPVEVCLQSSETARRIIQHLLEIILVDFDVPATAEVFAREKVLEIRLRLVTVQLEGYTAPIAWGKGQRGAVSTLGAFNLKLLHWIVSERGGTLELHNDQFEGAHLFLTLQLGKEV
jgi:GAF domain-containing protein